MFKHFYFYITIFAIAIFGIVLNSTYNQQFTHAGSGSSGDPYTVCAAGCDFTTITSAMQNVSPNEYIEVQASYNSTTESWPIAFGAVGVTLSCSAPSVSIGPTTTNANQGFTFTSSSVITGCTLDASNNDENNYFFTAGSGDGHSWQLTNNTIINYNVYQATTSLISGNTFIDSVFSFRGSTSTVSSNTITMTNASGTIFAFETGYHGFTVASNTIAYDYSGGDEGSSMSIFSLNSINNDITIVSNTISFSTSTEVSLFQMYQLAENFEFRGNRVKYIGSAATPVVLYARTTATSSISLTHNTFFMSNFTGGTDQRNFMLIEDDTTADTGPLFATATHNIFYFDGIGTTSLARAFQFKTNVASSIMYEDYNGFAGSMENPAISVAGTAAVAITSGGNSKYTVGSSPLRDGNVSTADDFLLNPFSSFLDVDGTIDIGAEPGVRGSSFGIDDNGTINYTSVHGTSTADIAANVRSGDTWTLAAGSYLPFALASSTLATSSVTIDGAGASTIIGGTSAYTYGVSVTGFSSLTLSDMLIQNASTTVSTYSTEDMVFTYGGSDYDGNAGDGANTIYIVSVLSGCTVRSFASTYSDGDVTALVDDSSDWHLALVDAGVKLGILVPGDVTSDPAALSTACGGVTIDKWVTSTFAYSDGVFTYKGVSAMDTDEGITMKSGFTDPPAITRTQSVSAGIQLDSSTNITVTNVTSTDNRYGVYFSGSTSGATINSSTLESSVLYDVYSDSTADNSIKNTFFTVASSSVSGVGEVDVYYRSRALVTSTASAIAGADVSFTRGDSSATAYATSTASGYTPWTDFLLAFSMTSSSIATTNGGYNPWTIAAAATSTYSASSTTATYNSPNQLVTLLLSTAPSVPTAPSSMTSSSVSDTAITTAWTDNSADETSFLFDYITGTDVSDFPGTTSSLAANTVSNSISSLTPNTAYTFRVAAVGSGGTSNYATSSAIYTSSTAPGTPSGTATGQTTMTVSWSANSNGTGTVYELYNVTDSSVVATTTAVTYAVTGLTANTSYQFKVRAQDLADSSSYSSYSSNSTAATTDAVPVVSSPSGGGSIPIAPIQPKFLEGVDAMNGALKINNGAATTDSTNVTLNFNVTNVSQVAISESIDFDGVSFVPYLPELPFTLSSGNGNKTVYVKLRSEFGGTLTVTDDIALTDQTFTAPVEDGACALTKESAYKTDQSPGVYYVTTSCTKRAFKRADTYFTYFNSWSEVLPTTQAVLNSIPDDTLGFMPLGPLYNPASGALIKLPNDPKVYLLLSETLYHIANEDAAIYQFGDAWVSWIDTVDGRVKDTHSISEEVLGTDSRPDGILVKYAADAKVYQLQTVVGEQVKRHVKDEATFNFLNFRWDRIVTIPETEVYADGESL